MSEPVNKSKNRYNIVDDNAYTEDGILIRRLYVPRLPNGISVPSLWNRFSQIGDVESVLIKKTRYEAYGIVTYVNSEDATEALMLRLLNAEPADSWRQPYVTRTNNRKMMCDDVINEKESLLLLDDDCLLHIFSYLNIIQLIRLETMCSRFFNLINSINYYKRFRFIDLTNLIIDTNTTLMEKRLILIRIGKYINALTIGDCKLSQAERFIEMIPKYCKHLVILNFSLKDLTEKFLGKYVPVLKQLKALTLYNCDLTDYMLDICLENVDKLIDLNISNNFLMNGQSLKKIFNLKFLNISLCTNIQPEYFSEFCLNNNTLKSLNIIDCYELNGRNIDEILQCLVNLEHLSISNCYNLCKKSDYCKFGNLPKLIEFEINFINNSIEINFHDLFIEFAKRNQLISISINNNFDIKNLIKPITMLTKLTEFIINGNNCVTDDDLLKIINGGTLKILKVTLCRQITNAVIVKCKNLCPDLKVSLN